ncbi:MAG: hypothetical protein HeimC3_18180 [Candidatus Heimdallarchaeota archaeon LC_3]|nr:MAG: hypothetical protein HeimC3_18180 [Candidatus Heimdallarchaeota archaeon LC_3]
MDQKILENLYVTGTYSKLLEEIKKLSYKDPTSKLSDIEKAICLSYHSRGLIRLGKIADAEKTLQEFNNKLNECSNNFSLSSLIYYTSVLNLLNLQGNIEKSLKIGLEIESLINIEKNVFSENEEIFSFWSAFLYYLIGMAYYYQFKHDLANQYLKISLNVNKNNLYIKGKSLYLISYIKIEKGEFFKGDFSFEESLNIFREINNRQGQAWAILWQGQFLLQKGNLKSAKNMFLEALNLFSSIKEPQGFHITNSLIGSLYFHQGDIDSAEKLLEKSFDSLVEIADPQMLTYCVIPLLLLYAETGQRLKATNCIDLYQNKCEKSSSSRIEINRLIAKAIYLKSSTRLIDKGEAQKIFLNLLNDPNRKVMNPYVHTDKSFTFFIIVSLIELSLEEFKISEDNLILEEVKQLIDNHIQKEGSKESLEFIELELIGAKFLIIEGKLGEALNIMEKTKEIAVNNDYHYLEDKINKEIEKIDREFKKTIDSTVKERIQRMQLEVYLQEAKKIQGII